MSTEKWRDQLPVVEKRIRDFLRKHPGESTFADDDIEDIAEFPAGPGAVLHPVIALDERIPRADLEAAASMIPEWLKKPALGPVRARIVEHRGFAFLDFPEGGPQVHQPSADRVRKSIDEDPKTPPIELYLQVPRKRLEEALGEQWQ